MTDQLRRWRIKFGSWEYWPMWLVYLPATIYFIYLSLKSRSFLFFSATNPTMENGGMCFESKWDIYQSIPPSLFPKTILVSPDSSEEEISQLLQSMQMKFPLIAKPDIGGKGWGVQTVHHLKELISYQQMASVPFIVQVKIDFPLELSIFYIRFPDQNKGFISSVTYKEMLSIIGDGVHNVETLIRKNDRAFLQLEIIRAQQLVDLTRIPAIDEKVELVPYGNHARGAVFHDYNNYIDEELALVFDQISKQIPDFYFGRFDIRTTNWADLKSGNNISILELNGAGAEAIHIYEPDFPFFKAQRIILQHFKWMHQIAMVNRKNGVAFISLKQFLQSWKKFRKYMSETNPSKLLLSHLNQKNTNV